jgi:hypothetical protein
LAARSRLRDNVWFLLQAHQKRIDGDAGDFADLEAILPHIEQAGSGLWVIFAEGVEGAQILAVNLGGALDFDSVETLSGP